MTAEHVPFNEIMTAVMAGGPSLRERLAEWVAAARSGAAPLAAAVHDGSGEDVFRWCQENDGPHVAAMALIACRQTASSDRDLAQKLLDRADETRPEDPTSGFQGLRHLAMAALVAIGYDVEAYDLAMQQAIEVLPDDSAAREAALEELAVRLSWEGRLYRLKGVLDLPPSDAPSEVYPKALAVPCFLDAVMCGRYDQAMILSEIVRIDASDPLLGPAGAILERLGSALFGTASAPQNDPVFDSVDALLAGDLQVTAHVAAKFDGRDVANRLEFCSWASIRCALATGDEELAETMLTRRAKLGRVSFIDGFFTPASL